MSPSIKTYPPRQAEERISVPGAMAAEARASAGSASGAAAASSARRVCSPSQCVYSTDGDWLATGLALAIVLLTLYVFSTRVRGRSVLTAGLGDSRMTTGGGISMSDRPESSSEVTAKGSTSGDIDSSTGGGAGGGSDEGEAGRRFRGGLRLGFAVPAAATGFFFFSAAAGSGNLKLLRLRYFRTVGAGAATFLGGVAAMRSLRFPSTPRQFGDPHLHLVCVTPLNQLDWGVSEDAITAHHSQLT